MSSTESKSTLPRENYFKEFKSSEWILIGFLRWRSQFTDFSNTQLEHSAWKTLLKNIASSANVYEESARLKAKELLSSFKVKIFLLCLLWQDVILESV